MGTILSLDLGKFKSVCCRPRRSSQQVLGQQVQFGIAQPPQQFQRLTPARVD